MRAPDVTVSPAIAAAAPVMSPPPAVMSQGARARRSAPEQHAAA